MEVGGDAEEMQGNDRQQRAAKGGRDDGMMEILWCREIWKIGSRTYRGTYVGSETVSHPGGTDTRSHRRQHRLAFATERSKRELSQRENNKKVIAETDDGIPASTKQNVCAIVS